ncbi:MAG TPA: hypothetical protein PLQ82_05640 [Desulfobacteraceae bacterium]|nr:hypothetical protein [Desulfobacteraceae bacterium]
MTVGGLIRSLGGWTEAKEILKGGVKIMGDERILGDSDFVDSIISQSEDHYERKYRLKRQGYDLDRIAERVAEVLDMDKDEVYSKGRQAGKVNARSLLCFCRSHSREILIKLAKERRKKFQGSLMV